MILNWTGSVKIMSAGLDKGKRLPKGVSMNTIEMKHLTKDYGNQRGIFDVSFSVKKGEVMGFLGPNGAGAGVIIRPS